jgi:tripartite-type tricarboxylate transporter receptor subunit TctC
MHGRTRYLIGAITALVLIASVAQATTHEFYQGKTIRIIVSVAAGGGFDTYSRTIARHLGKYIPGHPTIIVENMTGVGSWSGSCQAWVGRRPWLSCSPSSSR